MLNAALKPIEDWFRLQGWSAFDFQRETWNAYLDGRSGLVHAPTGMGKTYAVWLGPLAEELAASIQNPKSKIQNAIRVLWITPLRALANDTAENLRAAVDGLQIPWRVELRHGDTSPSLRQKQRKHPPEALITTPESLSVLLSYPGAGDLFRGIRCVIVDEWHELLASKRGVQTELALAHLRTLSPALRTWGLSATLGNTQPAMQVLLGSSQHPLGEATSGGGSGVLIRGDSHKQIVVNTILPDDVDRFPWSGHIGLRLLDQVIEAVERAKTTLIFTNVRSAAEIWFQAILKRRPDLLGQVALHHGSLDRDIRQQVEQLLREGRIRCVVCTSSLDLGVDFSPVDQVLQIGSPKGIARMMQRAGRSGHQPGARSTIIGVPTMALEMIEFAAARAAAGAGTDAKTIHDGARCSGSSPQVESREPLDRPLDVLVQHMVTLATGDGFEPEQLKAEVRGTHAFAALTDAQWQWCLDFVVRGGAALTAYPQYSRVQPDAATARLVVASKAIERMHRMSIGTITSDSTMKVAFANGSTLGMIEEGFISRLRPGDRFVFAGRVLELLRVHNMTAFVRPAKKTSGVVPRWAGAKAPLSTLLSQAIRMKMDHARRGVFDSPEMRKVRPLLELQARWSRIPAPDETLVELTRTRDGHHLFVFSFEGRLVHEGLCALVAHRVTQREPRSVQVTGNDYGFELQTLKPLHVDEAFLREVLSTDRLVEDLLACVNSSALARRQFREIARIAGLLFPGFPGQPKPMRQLQASSELFFDVFTQFDPGNLLLDQARREVLDRELEVVRMRGTLERIARSRLVIVKTQRLTPLSFPLWAESIRTQSVTSESWSDRVQRMVVELEAAATSDIEQEIHHGDHGEHGESSRRGKQRTIMRKRTRVSTASRPDNG